MGLTTGFFVRYARTESIYVLKTVFAPRGRVYEFLMTVINNARGARIANKERSRGAGSAVSHSIEMGITRPPVLYCTCLIRGCRVIGGPGRPGPVVRRASVFVSCLVLKRHAGRTIWVIVPVQAVLSVACREGSIPSDNTPVPSNGTLPQKGPHLSEVHRRTCQSTYYDKLPWMQS